MELPRTRPSGRNPTSRTSRNSLTDRSDVKIEPGLPGRSSARRRIASWGTPSRVRSAEVWSVIWIPWCSCLVWSLVVPRASASKLHPCCLAPLRVEGEDREAVFPSFRAAAVELCDRRSDDRRLGDVIPAVLLHRALALPDPQVHGPHHDTAGAEPGHVPLHLGTGVVPGLVHQVGIPAHLGVPASPPGLVDREPVVVPGADRGSEGRAGRNPARRPAANDPLASTPPPPPAPPRSSPPAVIRPIAWRRAWYSVCTMGPNE